MMNPQMMQQLMQLLQGLGLGNGQGGMPQFQMPQRPPMISPDLGQGGMGDSGPPPNASGRPPVTLPYFPGPDQNTGMGGTGMPSGQVQGFPMGRLPGMTSPRPFDSTMSPPKTGFGQTGPFTLPMGRMPGFSQPRPSPVGSTGALTKPARPGSKIGM